MPKSWILVLSNITLSPSSPMNHSDVHWKTSNGPGHVLSWAGGPCGRCMISVLYGVVCYQLFSWWLWSHTVKKKKLSQLQSLRQPASADFWVFSTYFLGYFSTCCCINIKGYSTPKWKCCYYSLTPMSLQPHKSFVCLRACVRWLIPYMTLRWRGKSESRQIVEKK